MCQELAELGFLLSWMAGAQWPSESRQQQNVPGRLSAYSTDDLGGLSGVTAFFCKLSLILTISFAKTQGDGEPGSAQQLCGMV